MAQRVCIGCQVRLVPGKSYALTMCSEACHNKILGEDFFASGGIVYYKSTGMSMKYEGLHRSVDDPVWRPVPQRGARRPARSVTTGRPTPTPGS